MTSFVVSMIIPSEAVIQGATGGLIVLLIAAQIVDYEGSALKAISRYVNVFCIPLLIWFAFNMIIQIARIITA
jgi:hypothetical protein